MTAPTVSVIVPCYNAAATLAETLDTALGQDVPLEVIAIDDGSTDATADILRGFGSRITALFGPNQGVSAARNRGFAASRGDFIQFVDSDDLLEPETLAARLAALQASGAEVAICDWREFSQTDGRRTIRRERAADFDAVGQDVELAFATHVWAPPVAVLYHRAVVEKVGGFRQDLPVIQDARHLFDAARAGARFVHAPHFGGLYRVLEDSLSRRSPARFARDVLTNGLQIEALWRADGALGAARLKAVGDIYDDAARGLLTGGDPGFLDAYRARAALGLRPTRRMAAAAALARVLGAKPVSRLFAAAGR